MSLVRLACTTSPFRAQEMARSAGSASSVTHGPIGPKPRWLLASENWGGRPALCSCRSLTSWPMVQPAPTTSTSSTSQSTEPATSGMSSRGPDRQDGNLVNVSGTDGTSAPVSSAWDR